MNLTQQPAPLPSLPVPLLVRRLLRSAGREGSGAGDKHTDKHTDKQATHPNAAVSGSVRFTQRVCTK